MTEEMGQSERSTLTTGMYDTNTIMRSTEIKVSMNDRTITFDKFICKVEEAGITELPLIRLGKGWKNPVATASLKLADGTLNPTFKLNSVQARESIVNGWNVGCYGAPDGIEIHDIDLEDGKFKIPEDKIEELIETFDTLTIMTRSGGIDFIFKNSGKTKNPHIYYEGTTDAGECRRDWQYAVVAGSFINKNEPNPENGKTKGYTEDATGMYEIIHDAPIREFDISKAPTWYKFEKNKATKKKQIKTSILKVNDEFIISKATASKIGDEFVKLMRGDTSSFNGDRSAADMSLANHIAFYTNDRKQIERLMTTPERLALNDKATRDTYLQSTIDKATEDPKREMYNPNYYADKNAALGLTENNSFNTDFGNEQRMLKAYPNRILYDTPNKTWYLWQATEGRWKPDVEKTLQEMVKEMIRGIRMEAAGFKAAADAADIETDEGKLENQKQAGMADALFKWWNKCQTPQRVNACLELLQSSVSVQPTDFNKDDNLFNCKNGTLDLRTMDLLPHDPAHLITFSCGWNYDKSAKCPEFIKFITRLFVNHPDCDELLRYVRMTHGYCLSGSTDHQIVNLLTGYGENGKSVLAASMFSQFGDYAAAAKGESFTTVSRGKIREDIAQLVGKRYLAVSEAAKGSTLDEDLIKNISGGSSEALKVRKLYGSSFNFYPKCKIFWSFNHTPNISDMTHSLWRRLKFIPFEEKIEADERRSMTDILSEHEGERSGILNWLIEGYEDLKNTKNFNWCGAVKTRTDESKEESDTLKPFLDEVCELWKSEEEIISAVPIDWRVKASILYDAYTGWAYENGYRYPMSLTTFGKEIAERIGRKNKVRTGTNGAIYYIGIKMKSGMCFQNPNKLRMDKMRNDSIQIL